MSKDRTTPTHICYICTGDKCKKHGSKAISKLLRGYVKEHRLAVGVIRTRCTDNCKRGPVVCLQPGSEWHFHVDEHKALHLLKKLAEDQKADKAKMR